MKRHILPVIVFVTLVVIFFRNSFTTPCLPAGGDAINVFGRVGFTLNNFDLFHYEDMTYMLSSPILLFQVILSELFSIFVSFQAIYIILLAIGFFSMYAFIMGFLSNNKNETYDFLTIISSTAGAVIYSFNPVVMDAILRGHIRLLFGYEFFPIIVYFILSVNNFRKSIYLSTFLVLFFSSSNPSFILMSFPTILALIVLGYLINEKKKTYIKNLALVLTISTSILLPYFLTLYYLKVPWLTGNLHRPIKTYFLYSHKNFIQAFTGIHNSPGITLPLSRELLLLFPVLAFFVFMTIPKLKIEKNKMYIYYCFGILSLFNILMSMGPHAPIIGDFLASTFEKYSFFNGLRSSYRFSNITYFIYAFLIATSIYYILSYYILKFIRVCNNLKVRVLISIILLGILVFSYTPMLMYGYKVVEYPNKFNNIVKLLKEKENNNLSKFYILVVPNYDLSSPFIMDNVYNKTLPKNVPFDLLRANGLRPTLGGQYKEIIKEMLIENKVNLTFLAELGIKYILIDKGEHFKGFKYVEQMKNSVLSKKGIKVVYEDNMFILAKNTLYTEKNIHALYIENWIRILGTLFYISLCSLLLFSLILLTFETHKKAKK